MSKADAFLLACPSRKVLDRVAEKWAALTLVALADGPMRFNEIKRRLEGVSQKVLTQTLRRMERDGIVKRTVVDARPLRVDYQLLSPAKSLIPLLAALKSWAEKNLASIEKANFTFDARHSAPSKRKT
jgi:DNA-binding HxlR family transcriptional regulator